MIDDCSNTTRESTRCASAVCGIYGVEFEYRRYTLHSRPAKLGRVETSRFTHTTKMRHPSTYDDTRHATRDAVTNIHVYQYCVHQESRQFIIIINFYYQIAVVMYSYL